jgi:hypothetical protein
MEDNMTWDLIEFWDTWHDINCDGTIRGISTQEEFLYNEAKNELFIKHEKKRADVETEAVKISL